MSMISGHCQIGMFLDDAVYILRSRMTKDPSSAMDIIDSLFFEGYTPGDEEKQPADKKTGKEKETVLLEQ